jgi:hypothetical protein
MKTCDARTRAGGHCRKRAGWGTGHVGEGRCRLHGGATPIKHGRYSTITRPRIRELLDQYEDDPAPLDLLPEAKLLRALLTDWVERYDEFTDALLAWHDSFRGEGASPKPRQTLDITTAAGLADKVGAMVDRIERHKREGGITLETLDRVLQQLGVEVVNALAEEVPDGVARAAILANIERRWHEVRLDPAPRAGLASGVRNLN